MSSPSEAVTLAQVLQEHGQFVRALALRLVRPAEEAEDVAQETLVRFLEHPPAQGGNLRGWLATVTRNLVRARARTRTQERAREERTARDERLPAAAQEVEQAELLKLVVNAAMELEEPYREAILARYLRGWSLEQVAAECGAPLTTVRSREQRALALLRQKLDRHFDSRRAWVGLLTTALRLPEVLPPLATPLAPLMLRGVALATLLAVGALVAWRVLAPGASSPRSSGGAAPAVGVSRAAELAAPTAGGRTRREPSSSPSGSTPLTSELAEIRGRLLDGDGRPAEGVALSLEGWPASAEREFLHGDAAWTDLATTSDVDGFFAFHFDPPGAFQFAVAVEDPRYAVLGWRLEELERGARHELAPATLEAGATIRGTVIDAEGHAVTGHAFQLGLDALGAWMEGGTSELEPPSLHASVSRIDGSFCLARVPSGVHTLVLEHELGERKGPTVQVAAGAELYLDFPCPALDFQRRLRLTFACPVFPPELCGLAQDSVRLLGPDGSVRTPDERWSFAELGPGPYRLEVDHPWFLPKSLDGIEAGGSLQVELEGSARARIVLVTPDGLAHAPDRIVVRYPTSGRSPDFFVPFEGGTPPVDGLVPGLLPGEAEIAVRVPGLGERVAALAGLQPHETRTVTLDFTGATALAGRVHFADGEPAAGVEVALLTPANKEDGPGSRVVGSPPSDSPHDPWRRELARVRSDEDGRYRFDLAQGGRFALRVEARRGAPHSSESFELRTGEVLERDVAVPRSATLEGRLTATSDVPLELLRLWARPVEPALAADFDDQLESAVAPDREGNFRLELLTPGVVRLYVLMPAAQMPNWSRSGDQIGGTRELTTVAVAEGELVHLDLALGALSPVRWRLGARVNGQLAPGVRLWMTDEFHYSPEGRTGADGWTTLWLFPGEVRPGAAAQGWSADLAPFRIEAGQAGERCFELEVVQASLRFLAADGQALAHHPVALFTAHGGEWSLRYTRRTDADGRAEFGLVPGSYGFAREAMGPARVVVPLDWTGAGPLVGELRL